MPFELASLVYKSIGNCLRSCSNGRHRANGEISWSDASLEAYVSELRP